MKAQAQEQPELLKIRGRFDRVDKVVNHSRVRIVDYKVSLRRSFQADELDLVNKALQGRQLQPPLYSFMTALNLECDSTGVGLSTCSYAVGRLPLSAPHARGVCLFCIIFRGHLGYCNW